ncbi:MAG: sulfotransferase family 2 domain-containing protein [Acidimicrobiales bacterium]|nr:sulfotransferase family 2 domain-containing protein [Acidimicrobiales bacterium]
MARKKPTTRDVIVHLHLFKNAGTSVARSLEDHFGPRFLSYDKPEAGGRLTSAELNDLIEANPKVEAFTSHQLRPPIVSSTKIHYLPIIFIRHPIDRIRSAYEFESKQGGTTLSSSLAGKTDFAGWIARHRTMNSSQCVNFQTSALGRPRDHRLGRVPRPTQDLINLGTAIDALDRLPAFGLVERYDESWQWITSWLHNFYPDFSAPPVKANTSGRAESLDQRLADIRDEIGDTAYERLLADNEFDLRLYDWAVGKFDRLAPHTLATDPIRVTESSIRPGGRLADSGRAHLVVHCGMANTGDRAIQTWAQRETARPDGKGSVRLLVDDQIDATTTTLAPSIDGPGELSRAFLMHWLVDGVDVDKRNDRFVRGVKRAAGDHPTVLLSSDGMAPLVNCGHEPFLHALETLALDFDVTVSMYVQPQHLALLSQWRSWGFSSGRLPSEWIRENQAALRYRDTVVQIAEHAPSVTFTMRPYRDDLFEGSSVVHDFTHHVLDIPGPHDHQAEPDAAALPLDVATLLRQASPGLLESGFKAGRQGQFEARRQLIADVISEWDLPESENAKRAAELVHRYAHAEFEASNHSLLEAYGWATDHLIPEPDTSADGTELEQLDALLAPADPPLAIDYLTAALVHIVKNTDRRERR